MSKKDMKEELTLNSLLTWEDFIALGDTRGESDCFLSKKVFKECCLTKEDRKELENNYEKYIYDKFKQRFPESNFPIDKLDIRMMFVKDEEGKWGVSYSIPHIFNSFYSYILNGNLFEEDSDITDKTMLALLLASDSENNLKEASLAIVNEMNAKIRAFIRELNSKINTSSLGFADKFKVILDSVLVNKRMLRWTIQNFDEVFKFFSEPFPIQVLEPVNKDRLMLDLVAAICTNSTINKTLAGTYDLETFIKYMDKPDIISALNYANNYRLMVEYISSENGKDYNIEVRIKTKNGSATFSSDEVITSFEEINKPLRENYELDKKVGFFHTYEEFLQSKVKKVWERINNKRLVKTIKLNFNMLQSGTKINIDRGNYGGKPRTEKGKAELQRQYNLMEAKIKYYGEKYPEVELLGIENFVGYFAQFHLNGCVVLDKLCRFTKDGKVLPSKNDAIYIMNYKEFANLCKCTKPELIDKKAEANPNIDRKYHSEGWQDRIDEVIDGYGYGGLDLDFLNRLVSELALEKSNNKELVKRIEKKDE